MREKRKGKPAVVSVGYKTAKKDKKEIVTISTLKELAASKGEVTFANVGKKKIKYAFTNINTIYADKYKGTTIIDGIKIVSNMIWWKLTKY